MVTVGISPGTRFTGIVVLSDRRLIKWQLMSFPRKWSAEKLDSIINAIQKWIDNNQATSVVIKIPDDLPVSNPYIQLVGAINVLCEQRNIQPIYKTLSEIKECYCNTKNVNKAELAKQLLNFYPELEPYIDKKSCTNKLHYEKLFEATACAHCIQNGA